MSTQTLSSVVSSLRRAAGVGMIPSVLLCVAVLTLAGCGQRGPLVLPAAPRPAAASPIPAASAPPAPAALGETRLTPQ